MSRKPRTRYGNVSQGPVRDEDHMMSGGLGPEPVKKKSKTKAENTKTSAPAKITQKAVQVNGTPKKSLPEAAPEEEAWETDDDEEAEDDVEVGEQDRSEEGEGEGSEDSEEEEEDEDEDGATVLAALRSKMPDISRLLESDSSSDEEDEVEGEDDEQEDDTKMAEGGVSLPNGAAVTSVTPASHKDDEEDDGEDEDEDIALSDIASVASDERGDLVPFQRLTINNTTALTAAWKRIALPLSTLPFSLHQSVTTTEPVSIPDVEDDLSRELAFYKQSLDAVQAARTLLKKEGTPFSRPTDYFAEMVKSDEHMGRVRQKLVDAAAGKKASADAKRQRDLKKFGKQVQVAKLQERAKEKRETLEKIGALKRKRAGGPLTNENEPDMFDVSLDDSSHTQKRLKPNGKGKRDSKNTKYGFGGKKRFAKSNDAASSGDMRGFSTARMKGKAPAGKAKAGKVGKSRPGKSRRAKGKL